MKLIYNTDKKAVFYGNGDSIDIFTDDDFGKIVKFITYLDKFKPNRIIKFLKIIFEDREISLSKFYLVIAHWYLPKLLNVDFFVDQWLNLEDFQTSHLLQIYDMLTQENQQSLKTRKFFPEFNPMLLDSLKHCKKSSAASNKKVNLIDLGAGAADSAWKWLLAGCRVYIVDQLYKKNKELLDSIEAKTKYIVPKSIYENNFHIIEKSLYELPKDFFHKFEIVYTHQVLSIQPPSLIKDFVTVVDSLMTETGVAFIGSDSINPYHQLPNCKKASDVNKKNNCIAPNYLFAILDLSLHQVVDCYISYLCEADQVGNISQLDLALAKDLGQCYDTMSSYYPLLELFPYMIYPAYNNFVSLANSGHATVIGSFDTDDLERYFSIDGMRVLDRYYYGFLDVGLSLNTDRIENGAIAAIKVSKYDIEI